MKIYEANNAALKLWTEATGLKKNDIFGEFRHYHEGIRQAQEVDPTALTTFMILRSTVRSFASEQKFDGLEILENPDAVLKRTEKLRELLWILNDAECQAEVAAFQKKLKEEAETMGLLGTVKKVIGDVQELAYIRRDALLGFKELKIHHFRAGKRGDKKPKYNENILKFWNMNSVIQAAQMQPVDGISMVMVRDPVDLFSYFCFLIVNGENISIVSDLPAEPHPLHKYMSRARSQARRFEDRAMRLRFPYQLFDFTFNDDGYYTGEKSKNGLVRTNAKAVIVKPVKDLEPDQALWAMLMFDLLAEQYWNQEQKPVEISYTADGMRAGLGKNSRALILPGQAVVAPLTRADMHRDKLAHVYEKPTGQNDWLEDRYAHLVPEKAFNMIGNEKVYRLLNGAHAKPKGLVPKTEDVGPVFNTGTIGWKNKSWELSAVEATLFGTPEKMESDRRFIARVNQAIIIEAEASKEFHSRKAEILSWYDGKVKANLDKIFHHVALGTFESEIQNYRPQEPGEGHRSGDFDAGVPQKGNILSQWENPKGLSWRTHEGEVKLFSMNPRRTKYLCHLSGQQVSVWTCLSPMTPKSLADIAGCKVEELPDVLQHWYRNERYYGNQILNRLDPMEWKCQNPWRSLRFTVMIGLSKRSWNALVKKYKLPRRELKKRND